MRKLHMRQIYKIIPIYTADVSGVCSALYELGGMTVMHDPSGCNSTYNTHDEIRWYDQDSMIYISGLTEIDAVMGNDEKLIRDIEIAAEELKPKFIALAGSPIPYMNGTDFEAIAKILEQDLGIPAIFPPPGVPSKRPPDSPLPPVREQGFPVYLPSPRSTTPSIPPVPHSVSMHPHAPVVRNRAVSHQEDSRSLASLLSFLRYVSQSLQVLFQHHIHNHACRL